MPELGLALIYGENRKVLTEGAHGVTLDGCGCRSEWRGEGKGWDVVNRYLKAQFTVMFRTHITFCLKRVGN